LHCYNQRTFDEYREAAAACCKIGTYSVLVGTEGERDWLLSSPIVSNDHLQIAPESTGDLFDGIEIDEILTLRILTLTNAEKQEMRTGDPHAQWMLERSEALPAEHFMKMHSLLRDLWELEGNDYE
jgi:hypothetical protein